MKVCQSSACRFITGVVFAGIMFTTGLALVKSMGAILNFATYSPQPQLAAEESIEPVIVTATSMEPEATPATVPAAAPTLPVPAPATESDTEKKSV